MTLWEYLDRRAERSAHRNAHRKLDPRLFANVIGGAMIGGFLGSLITLFVIPIPRSNEQLITYMIGQLSGFAGGIIAYHYASKSGEQALEAERVGNTRKALETIGAAISATPENREPDGEGEAQ